MWIKLRNLERKQILSKRTLKLFSSLWIDRYRGLDYEISPHYFIGFGGRQVQLHIK
jgi:hypothetical protein